MARFHGRAALLALAWMSPLALADWPSDPAQNLLICNAFGQQIAPKIAVTSQGGCYVGWYDNDSGNFDLYLQRLGENGTRQWQENGICVSAYPQSAEVTDWSMVADAANHCVLALNDIRAGGGDLDIYGFRTNENGSAAWGGGGRTLSDNANHEPDPRLVETSDGNFFFVWEEHTASGPVVNLRKLNPSGSNCWLPHTVTLSSTHGLSSPRVVACENDGAIVQYLKHQSADPETEKHIYVQKFNAAGAAQWPNGGVAISTAGALDPDYPPQLIADGSGGAYSVWHDLRSTGEHHVYAQHIAADGTVQWTENGVRASLTETALQLNPSLIAFPSGDVMIFYETTDVDDAAHGVGGQLLSASGVRRWTYHGMTFLPTSGMECFNIRAFPFADGAMVVFMERAPGSSVGSVIKAFRTDSAGTMLWPGSTVTVCDVPSQKGPLTAAINHRGQVFIAWSDTRSDASGDLYLQNINPDGTLGDYVPAAADDHKPSRSDEFAQMTTFPNPFNAAARIAFSLPKAQAVQVIVYDALGREAARLADGVMTAGAHELIFDGAHLASGMYICRLTTESFVRERTMLLIK